MTTEQFNAGLCEFLAASPTPFHAVETIARALSAAGFVALTDDANWELQAGGRYYLVRNGSSIVAWTHGSSSAPEEGMRMVGAHTDSPCLMVKPNPELLRHGCFQLGVEVYGGALLNPWFDRDLSIAGRVSYSLASGDLATALVDLRDPVATVPSLAIHLDREVNNSRKINAQTDIVPLLALYGGGDQPEPALRRLLQQQLEARGLSPVRVLDYELCLYDTQPAAVIGLERDFIAGARLDNLLSCYVGMQALLAADGSHSALLVCNDHEEVGSMSAAGAQGPLLRSTLQRIAGSDLAMTQITQRSMMVSADNAHAIHPNYADRHDERHGPRMNDGPVIKVNSNQRYATSSETAGLFRLLAERVGVALQTFVVRSDMACGSTIGPLTAAGTGIRTLDIGVPTLGMHSVRELAGSADAHALWRVLGQFYAHPGPLAAVPPPAPA